VLGDLPAAETYARRKLVVAESIGRQRTTRSHLEIGKIALCRGAWDEARDAFERALQTRDSNYSLDQECKLALGRAYLARGLRGEAAGCFQDTLQPAPSSNLSLVHSLSGLEEALDDPEAFRAFCQRFREERPEADAGPLTQWFLEPTAPLALPHQQVRDEFGASLSSEWAWHDPLGDCSFTEGHGVEIHAANGRDLWHINWSAPRLLRPASGELAIQTVCSRATEEKPAVGGLLLWKDRQHYLHFTWGQKGARQLAFGGCIGDDDRMIGRGRLQAERVFLRLERHGDSVHALCSADGESWFTVGQTRFPVGDTIEVGLHAIGMIERTIYPGAYPDGTAIRFERFELW
jgi:regulation of enolase protein 1 (concanavalin A-like superfamily)